jgi:hypothetical protein
MLGYEVTGIITDTPEEKIEEEEKNGIALNYPVKHIEILIKNERKNINDVLKGTNIERLESRGRTNETGALRGLKTGSEVSITLTSLYKKEIVEGKPFVQECDNFQKEFEEHRINFIESLRSIGIYVEEDKVKIIISAST